MVSSKKNSFTHSISSHYPCASKTGKPNAVAAARRYHVRRGKSTPTVQSGSVKRTVVPCPALLSAKISPPWATTRFLAMVSPSPLQLLVLDLISVGFVHPEGIIALVTAGRLWHGTTMQPVCLRDLRPDVHRYLERMDVFRQCDGWLKQEVTLAEDERFDRSCASPNAKTTLRLVFAG